MGWKTFELTNVKTQQIQEYDLPQSAPAPVVQDAKELMVGDAKGVIENGEEKVQGNIKAKNLLKAADHIVKETLGYESFPRNNNLEYNQLDGNSLEKLKDHYMEVDLKGKNSDQSGGKQSSSQNQ